MYKVNRDSCFLMTQLAGFLTPLSISCLCYFLIQESFTGYDFHVIVTNSFSRLKLLAYVVYGVAINPGFSWLFVTFLEMYTFSSLPLVINKKDWQKHSPAYFVFCQIKRILPLLKIQLRPPSCTIKWYKLCLGNVNVAGTILIR